MTTLRFPEYHADLAKEHEAAGRYVEAEQEWYNAKACTIGHKRADRYYEAAQRCRKLAEAKQ